MRCDDSGGPLPGLGPPGRREIAEVRLHRRRFLAGASLGVAALGIPRLPSVAAMPRHGVSGIKSAYQRGTLKVALVSNDLMKVQPLLDIYSKQHKVTISTETYPYQSLFEKIRVDLKQATSSFDIVSLDDPWMPLFSESGLLADIANLSNTAAGTTDGDVVPELLRLGAFPPAAGLFGIPWIGNVQVFAHRTDVFDELGLRVPATWDDVIADAERITQERSATGLYGFGLRGRPGNSAATSFLPVLRGYGIDIFQSPEVLEPQLETDAARGAMTTFLKLAALAPPGAAEVGHVENGRNMLGGRVAQSADIWPDQLLQMANPALSKVPGKIGVGVQPAVPGANPATLTGAWLWGIPARGRRPDAAIDLVAWLTAPEQQKRLLMEHQTPPTRLSVLLDEAAVARFPFLPDVLKAMRSAKPRPRTAVYPQVEEILGRYVAQAIAGQVDGDDALTAANAEIRALMVSQNLLRG